MTFQDPCDTITDLPSPWYMEELGSSQRMLVCGIEASVSFLLILDRAFNFVASLSLCIS